MMTNLKAVGWTVLLVGAGAFMFWQNQQIERLRAERAVLQEQVRQTVSQRDEIQRLDAQLKATVERSEAAHSELMRLRAQASRFRQIEQENAQIKIERQRLVAQASQKKPASDSSNQQQDQLPANEVSSPLTSVTNFGVIELSDATPMRLALGEGRECVVTTTVLDDGQLEMVFTFESEIDGVPIQTKQTTTAPPGRQIAKVIDGVEIALTPTLKAK